MGRKLTVALAGLGSRGKDMYAPAAKLYPDKMEITAIADIDPEKVKVVAEEYHVPADRCYASAEEMLAQEKLADVMFITTQDRQHVGHAIPALRKGYDLLLEKPVSPDLDECREIVKVAEECGRKVVVCHVLRYTPFYSKVKELIDSGIIGEIVNVTGMENVGYWHQSHSFVRGNWRNSETTSPMILQKCCHDMDLLLWLTGKTCEAVSSFGGTYLFKKEKAPEGATLRCLDGCRVKAECPYDAEKIYITNELTGVAHGNTEWPSNVLALNPTEENIREAIKTGPYGRCVYHCDNNVVDHQVVNLNMTDGSTISFTMSGLTERNSRVTKFMGTKGEIVTRMEASPEFLDETTIEITPFGEETMVIYATDLSDDFSGHGGGDVKMVEEFIDMVSEGREPANAITTLDKSIESHFMALAAERSRTENGRVVTIAEMKN